MNVFSRCASLAVCVGLLSLHSVSAQSVVRVDTPLGDFSLELFDEVAPVTVKNFVNYVITGRYQDSLVHRVEPGFVIQGGLYRFLQGSDDGLTTVPIGPTIVNEPGESNLRGTVAMAKVANDPDSATSQWYINLGDNTGLDGSNGGFTVFGRVIGDGMQVVDAVAAAQQVNAGLAFPLPVINYDGGGTIFRSNLVFTDMTLVSGDYQLPNYYDPVGDRVHIRVNGGSAGIAALTLNIVESEPQVKVRAELGSLEPLSGVETGFSFFVPDSGRLVIPELGINGTVVYRNLEFTLTDPEQLIFTLQ